MAFRCSACGAEFETRDDLDTHVREEHQAQQNEGHQTEEFRCPACGAVFDTQEELDAHAKAEHAA